MKKWRKSAPPHNQKKTKKKKQKQNMFPFRKKTRKALFPSSSSPSSFLTSPLQPPIFYPLFCLHFHLLPHLSPLFLLSPSSCSSPLLFLVFLLIHSFFFFSSSLSPFTWCLLHCFFLFSILLLLSPHLSIMSFISSFDSPVHHRTQTTTTSKPLPSPSAAPVSPVQWTHPGCITLKHLQRDLQASKAKVISTPSHHLFPQQLHVSLPLSLPGRPPHH